MITNITQQEKTRKAKLRGLTSSRPRKIKAQKRIFEIEDEVQQYICKSREMTAEQYFAQWNMIGIEEYLLATFDTKETEQKIAEYYVMMYFLGEITEKQMTSKLKTLE